MFRCYSYTIIRERINLCFYTNLPVELPDDGVTVTPKYVRAVFM